MTVWEISLWSFYILLLLMLPLLLLFLTLECWILWFIFWFYGFYCAKDNIKLYGTLGINEFDILRLCHNWKYGKGLERCSALAEDLSSVPMHLECSRGFETPLASVSAKKDLVPVARGSHCEVTALAAGPFCSVSQSLGLRVNHLVHLRFCFYLERRLEF